MIIRPRYAALLSSSVASLSLSQESLNSFETAFVDVKSGATYTQTFHLGEPVLYHPAHKATPVLSHISEISHEFFTCGDSTTGRMIPRRLAQRWITKLSLGDIEDAAKGPDMPLGERLLWKTWLEQENSRIHGRKRIRAPCCGRIIKRLHLEELSPNVWCCTRCKQGDWGEDWIGELHSEAAEKMDGCAVAGLQAATAGDNSNAPLQYPWRQEQARRHFSKKMDTGVVVTWNKHSGFARFLTSGSARVMLQKDHIDFDPVVGDVIEGPWVRENS